MNKNIIILFIVFSFSCVEKEKSKAYLTGESISMHKVDSIQFSLDSLSNGRNTNSYINRWKDRDAFSFLNKNNNSLYFYDINTSGLLEVLKFPIEGPDGVGSISSYYFINEDSLFLYSYGLAQLSILNSNKKVLKRINIESDLMSVRPEVNSGRPLGMISGNLIFNSWGSEREYYNNDTFPKNSFLFLNLYNNSKAYDISYPDSYKGAVWGVQFFQVYHDFNFEDSLMILSYPIDNNLYVYNLKRGDLIKKHSENNISVNVDPISEKDGKFTLDIMEEVNHQMRQEYYSFVKYDKYNKLYYRIINHQIPEGTIVSGDRLKTSFGSFSIIIYDNEFNFKDIIKIPPYEYYIQSIFFHDKKIYLEKIQTTNEDLLIFDIFELK